MVLPDSAALNLGQAPGPCRWVERLAAAVSAELSFLLDDIGFTVMWEEVQLVEAKSFACMYQAVC